MNKRLEDFGTKVLNPFAWSLMLILATVFFNEVRAAGVEEIPDINLSWSATTTRTDGTRIESLDGYKLYHTHDNNPETVIDVAASETAYSLVDVPYGTHVFEISAVENGLEGPRARLVIDADEPAPEQPAAVVQFKATLEVCVNGNCETVSY